MRVSQTADDYQRQSRSFLCQQNPTELRLEDQELKVYTYDFEFRSYSSDRHLLPGKLIVKPPVKPPDWQPECVSCHANASEVANFIKKVLNHVPLDETLLQYISSINFLKDPDIIDNYFAAWLGHPYYQAVFGQCTVNGERRSLATAQDVVAHEFFHGLTSQIVGFVYSEESGALDESYADIFAILVSNFRNTDIGQWNWEIGRGLGRGGSAIRDFSNPRGYEQPDHWNYYRPLPVGESPNKRNDYGWVHHNSGIHNKAAYNLLTSQDDQGNYLLDATSAAKLFYQALSDLSNTSTFSDSRRALALAAKTFLRKARRTSNSIEIAKWENIVGKISSSFDDVGIQ